VAKIVKYWADASAVYGLLTGDKLTDALLGYSSEGTSKHKDVRVFVNPKDYELEKEGM